MTEIKIDERLERIERLLIASKRVLTFDEASEYSGISKSYLYKLTAAAKIPHSKPSGKTIYFDKEELDKFLLENRVKTQKELAKEVNDYILKKHKA